MRTVQDVLRQFPGPSGIVRLEKPIYSPPEGGRDIRIGLAVASMKDHTTDEGWQLFLGLNKGGYLLVGGNLTSQLDNRVYVGLNDVPMILNNIHPTTS